MSSSTANGCPECSGSITRERTEKVCSKCGLVISENSIDRGPEWRSYSFQENESRSRVGAPRTETMHDNGLSTRIGYSNGKRGDQKTRRLKKWNRRLLKTDSTDRSLSKGFLEIQRMSSALGGKKNTREIGCSIYRQATNNDVVVGRSIEGVASASLYLAFATLGNPRTFDEIIRVSRVGEERIKRDTRNLMKELDIGVEPQTPDSFIPRWVSNLAKYRETEKSEFSDIERTANELWMDLKNTNYDVYSGKSPSGFAAALLYLASKVEGYDGDVTQSELADVADTTEVTIRNRYQDILGCIDKDKYF